MDFYLTTSASTLPRFQITWSQFRFFDVSFNVQWTGKLKSLVLNTKYFLSCAPVHLVCAFKAKSCKKILLNNVSYLMLCLISLYIIYLKASLTEKKEHLEKLQQQNSRLEHEVKRFQEREKHLEKIRVLEKKKPWAVSITIYHHHHHHHHHHHCNNYHVLSTTTITPVPEAILPW